MNRRERRAAERNRRQAERAEESRFSLARFLDRALFLWTPIVIVVLIVVVVIILMIQRG